MGRCKEEPSNPKPETRDPDPKTQSLKQLGRWEEEPSSSMVIISSNLSLSDQQAIKKEWARCAVGPGPGPGTGPGLGPAETAEIVARREAAALQQHLESEPLFQTYPYSAEPDRTGPNQTAPGQTNRHEDVPHQPQPLASDTGSGPGGPGREAGGAGGPVVVFGVRETDEMRLHGFYSHDLNRSLMAAVNETHKGAGLLLLTPAQGGAVQYAVVGEEGTAAAAFAALRASALDLLGSLPISSCRCGF